ncbi:MAG: hypothetical protein B6D77_17495 [gamma proteobacterium symbiont of Ctena orbiculata]|nr:MAG: hypothetical protein B6D77_17495 [gamma proteobacterium symbiont of Ctena orbiculata]PVV21443.1 MAG: hypothetical protein B6D78_07900 [gamma proteobacterium symbiont of Ctena orbiculata]
MAISNLSRGSTFLLLFTLFVAGCSDRPLSPEEQLRNILSEAESYLEARDLSSAMEFVDPAYEDRSGRDFRALKAMLLSYFMRHKSIHIVSKIDQIDLRAENESEVVLFAGLAGSSQEAVMAPAQWRGDLLRLQLLFKRGDGDDWRLRMAEWRRATPQDFSF